MKKYYDEIILKKYMDFFPPILMADDYLATDKILIIYILKRSLACTSCKPKCQKGSDAARKTVNLIFHSCDIIYCVNVKIFPSSLKYGSQVIIMLSSCNKKNIHTSNNVCGSTQVQQSNVMNETTVNRWLLKAPNLGENGQGAFNQILESLWGGALR